MLRLSFFGLGRVGTVYAAGFASKGFPVIGFDIEKERLRTLASGKSPFFEPYLEDLISRCMRKGTLKVASDPQEAVLNSDITFMTVGTPSMEDGSIGLKHVMDSSKMIGEALQRKGGWHLVVVKSTVVPRTTENVVKVAVEETSGKTAFKDFGLAVNPEFLREGSAVEDFIKQDRVVIGTNDKRSRQMLEEVYSSFDCPKLITNLSTAELIKYTNNAFLAMKVSFINMIANLCQKAPGADVESVAQAIGFDKRIGSSFLSAGAGWGGSCWAKDLNALRSFGKRMNVELPLVNATLDINERQPYRMIELAEELIGNLEGKRVAILGLAFKPNTDDIREAVSIKIVDALLDKGAIVVVYDPAAMKNFKRLFNNKIFYAKSALECIKNTDCAMVVTEWEEFKNLQPETFLSHMKHPVIVDGRRIYDVATFSPKLKFAAIGLHTGASS